MNLNLKFLHSLILFSYHLQTERREEIYHALTQPEHANHRKCFMAEAVQWQADFAAWAKAASDTKTPQEILDLIERAPVLVAKVTDINLKNYLENYLKEVTSKPLAHWIQYLQRNHDCPAVFLPKLKEIIEHSPDSIFNKNQLIRELLLGNLRKLARDQASTEPQKEAITRSPLDENFAEMIYPILQGIAKV